jgi:hypothetical protein
MLETNVHFLNVAYIFTVALWLPVLDRVAGTGVVL